MKTKELLQQILDKLNDHDVNGEAEAEPSRFASIIQTSTRKLLRGDSECAFYMLIAEMGETHEALFCVLEEGHTDQHLARAKGLELEWWHK